MKSRRMMCIGVSAVSFCAAAAVGQYGDEYENEPINYSTTAPQNLASRLQAEIDDGRWRPDRTSDKTFLRALLERFDVPVESQVLVFSKTSVQNSRITPQTPRAVYFSDDCYIGWVQGGLIEVACTDPNLGPVFYTLDHRNGQPLRFNRDRNCLSCHGGPNTGHTPGVLVRSVFPDGNGLPIFSAGTHLTTHKSPFERRWGGWYVTGTHGRLRHMGNTVAERKDGRVTLDVDAGANLTVLASRIEVAPYLTATSDIVALMVLEHQVSMQNALTRANHKTRQAIHRQHEFRKILGEPPGPALTGSGLRLVQREADKVVEQLLFCGELRLREEITGSPAFQQAFLAKAKRSASGRSLRDFHLGTRLFVSRCSYMIHSAAFDALPKQIQDPIYAKLLHVLAGRDDSEMFAHLGRTERARILEILRDTKTDLPDAWRKR